MGLAAAGWSHYGILNAIVGFMDEDTDFPPGDGPSSGISVTLTAGTLHAIRERVGKRGVSAYLEKAAQRQIERENLDELIAGFEEVHGPADPEAVAAKRARLTGGAPGAGAAA
ncbi:hypothetical protein GCM10010094_24600 [Streptomyces flaveus]|uniref:CopG family transcriptional regulator n=2 Tax=Streptomyces flaveus TaxID=66370 RepID=A0A917QQC5_9ACTN|nr:hypothetical protein GCM10010094_24600 [Streptomyces flaveus]